MQRRYEEVDYSNPNKQLEKEVLMKRVSFHDDLGFSDIGTLFLLLTMAIGATLIFLVTNTLFNAAINVKEERVSVPVGTSQYNVFNNSTLTFDALESVQIRIGSSDPISITYPSGSPIVAQKQLDQLMRSINNDYYDTGRFPLLSKSFTIHGQNAVLEVTTSHETAVTANISEEHHTQIVDNYVFFSAFLGVFLGGLFFFLVVIPFGKRGRKPKNTYDY